MPEIDLQQLIDGFTVGITKALSDTLPAALSSVIPKLQNFGNVAKDVAQKVDESFDESFSSGIKSLQNLGNAFKNITSGLGDFVEKSLNVSSMNDAFGATSKIVENLSSQFNLMTTELNAVDVAALATTMKFTNFGGSMREVSGDAAEMSLQFSSALEKLGIPMNNVFGNMIKAADVAKNLENALIANAAASGNYSAFLETLGTNFESLNSKATQFGTQIASIGAITGRDPAIIAKYAFELNKIPGAMESFINLGEKPVNTLEAIVKAAVGMGNVDVRTIIGQMNDLFRELNTSTGDALGTIAKLNDAAQKSRIPLDIMNQYLKSSTSSFRFLTDNAEQAVDVFNSLAPAMRAGGLGVSAISDLATKVTTGLTNLGIAQKAFLSGQTGGPGGLKGAFEIEMMIKEGNLDKVREKMESIFLKMSGGRAVTREEAAKSDTAAAQLTKQIQLLTTGPLKMFESQAQAMAYIESIARREDVIKLPEPVEKADVMTKAIDAGSKLQEKQITELNKINEMLERMYIQGAALAYSGVRKVAGSERDQESLGIMSKYMSDLSTMISGQKLLTATGEAEGAKEGTKALSEHLDLFANTFKDLAVYSKPQLIERETVPVTERSGMIDKFVESISGMFGREKEVTIPGAVEVKSEKPLITSEQFGAFITESLPKFFSERSPVREITSPEMSRTLEMTAGRPPTAERQTTNINPAINVEVKATCIKCNREMARDEAIAVVSQAQNNSALGVYGVKTGISE